MTSPNLFSRLTVEQRLLIDSWLASLSESRWNSAPLQTALHEVGIVETPGNVYTCADAAVARVLVGDSNEWAPNADWVLEVDQESGGLAVGDDVAGVNLGFPSRLLFKICWGESGPGDSWPVSYRLFFVAPVERHVVVASLDDIDMFGYKNFAIGHFRADQDASSEVKRIIVADWTRQQDEVSQERWSGFISRGLVDKSAASNWADEVWTVTTDDFDGIETWE